MKRLLFVCILLFTVVGFAPHANANEINSIDILITINEDGSIDVTEKRAQNMTEGTEMYMVFDDDTMQGAEITNFSVEGFTEEEPWNSDASLEEKKGKYGILDTSEGTELVWGIGDHTKQEYIVHYSLSNMVKDLKDGQSLYWDFNTFNELTTDKVTLTVESFKPFTYDDVKFWGFGFIGDLQLEDGKLVWKSTESLQSSDYATLLLQFPRGTFNVPGNNALNQTVKEQQEQALKNSNYEADYLENNTKTKGAKGDSTGAIIGTIFGVFGTLIATVVTFIVIRVNKIKERAGHIKSAHKLKIRNENKVTQTAPDVEDFPGIYFFLKRLNMAGFEAFFQAYLVKWQEEGRITISYKESDMHKKITKRKSIIQVNNEEDIEKYDETMFKEAIKAIKNKTYDGSFEFLYWLMLAGAMDAEGRITDKEMKKWAKVHAKDVAKMADYLTEYSMKYLEENHYIEIFKKKVMGVDTKIVRPTEEGEALIDTIIQYNNFFDKEAEQWAAQKHAPVLQEHDLIWDILTSKTEKIDRYYTKYSHTEEPYNNMMYYYYTMSVRQEYVNGLAAGGFSSSNGASGAGGATASGGGAGAGGGGGGGAR